MVGREVVFLRIRGLDLCRILGCQSSGSVVDEYGRLRIRDLLYTSTAGVVVVLTDDLITRVPDLGLFVVAVKREAPSFRILNQIAVRIECVTLSGREPIIRGVDRRMIDIGIRNRQAVYRLGKTCAISKCVIAKRLLPIGRRARFLFRLGKPSDRIIFVSLNKTCCWYRRRCPGDHPDILARINRTMVARYLTVLEVDLPTRKCSNSEN